MLNSNGSSYGMEQTTMGAMNFVLEEQDALNRNMKPVFNKYIDQAIDLQKNDSCQRSLSKSEDKFKRALSITKKNKYARSSVLSNLSQLYCNHYQILPGGIVHNLKKSIQYLEEVLKINERKVFGHKYAHTLTKLGNVYRRCAMEPLWLEESEICLEKAKKYHKRALSHSEKNSPYLIHLITASEIYFNLSSVCFDMDDISSGCEYLEKSFVYFLKALDINDEVLKLLSFDVVQHLSVCFARLDYFGAGKYQSICDEILNVADGFGIERGRLVGTHPIADITNPEMLIEYMYKKAKITLDTTGLNKHISNLLESRRTSPTDQEADRQALLAQQTASKLARLLCDQGQAMTAFERLEYCSGLRYTEASFLNWYKPKNKYDYLLTKISMRLGALYYEFGQTGLVYTAMNEVDKSTFVSQLIQSYKDKDISLDDPILSGFIDYSYRARLLEKKLLKERFDIVASQHAEQILLDINTIDSFLHRPSNNLSSEKIKLGSISSKDIESVLREYIDLVLIKLDVQINCGELLIIVASNDSGQFLSKSISIDIPNDVIDNINQYVYESKDDSFVKWNLDFIDWSEVLPARCNRVALLPSFFAANIPWLSSGIQGQLLIDLVDEVVYLPSILHLRHKNIVEGSRSGEVYVNGGNTQFQANPDIKNDLSFDSKDKNTLLTSLKDKSIFSYYGHCAHQDGGRAALKFEGFDLYDLELQPVIKGMERIEFWSCQSGKNLPSHIMGSPVNEPFGMDMEMLKQGVETSIGSLWSVPELSTLHIKHKYDENIAEGMTASVALLSAQRWWLHEGADQEVERCKALGIVSYLRKYKCNNLDDESIISFLGPIKKNDVGAADLDLLAFKFKHPISWAGFRFCGLPEHKSERLPEDMTVFTSNEISRVKNALLKLNLRSGYL